MATPQEYYGDLWHVNSLHAYVEYYLKSRTLLSLNKDAPVSRPVASPNGGIVVIPQFGGLHHRYERRAA